MKNYKIVKKCIRKECSNNFEGKGYYCEICLEKNKLKEQNEKNI